MCPPILTRLGGKNEVFTNFTTTALFNKVIPVIPEPLTAGRIIYLIVSHFTGGKGLSVNFRVLMLYPNGDAQNGFLYPTPHT